MCYFSPRYKNKNKNNISIRDIQTFLIYKHIFPINPKIPVKIKYKTFDIIVKRKDICGTSIIVQTKTSQDAI